MTKSLGTARQWFMPYCLQRQADGRYAVLNRKYKPLGTVVEAHVRYEDLPCLVRFPTLTPALARLLSWKGSDDLDAIYLYMDGTQPQSSTADLQGYAARLHVLMELPVEQ